MASHEQPLDLIAALSEIPSKCKNRDEALQRIAQLGQQAMGGFACALVSVDLQSKQMKQIACASSDQEFTHYLAGLEFGIGNKRWVKFDLIEKGEVVEKYDLQNGGQGVADPEVARKYGLAAVLAYPLYSDDKLFGYINAFSNEARPFNVAEKQLMEILARQAVIAIEKFDSQKTVAVLNDLSCHLLVNSPQDFLRAACEKACELFDVPVCIIWRLDKRNEQFAIEAANKAVDDEYRKITLAFDDDRVSKHLNRREVSYLTNVAEVRSKYVYSEAARQRGWASLLSAPMWAEDQLFGFLDIYTRKQRHYTVIERKQIRYFADQVALSFQKAELLKEAEYGKRLGKLLEIMLEMAEATTKKEVLKLLLDGGLELVEKKDGLIRLLNYRTGMLEVDTPNDDTNSPPPDIEIGKGITGLALREEIPRRVDDVASDEWKNIYVKFFKDMRSALAVPILIRKTLVRVGREVKFGTKPIGVLNIESPEVSAFTKSDEECLWSLSRYAAIIIENLEYDNKLTRLRLLGEKLIRIKDYDSAIKTIITEIKNTLGAEYINISVIVPEQHSIKCEFIEGIPDEQKAEFKRDAIHALKGKDIQADIVRSGETEVLEKDQRFDKELYEKYGHNNLIRIFVPMLTSQGNRIIGTVVVGYNNKYRKLIYERDVKILKDVVNYIGQIVEREKSGLRVDQITHELKSPVVGIKSHASLLRGGGNRLSPYIVDAKFDDIIADCEILFYQIGMLSHELGLRGQVSRPEKTNVFRDIIIKTLNQIVRPVIRRKGISASKIEYDSDDIHRVVVIVDKGRLNQVVYNLLMNSIKYAKRNLDDFKISVEVEVKKYDFIIKFSDWGIGVEDGYEEKIFEEGVRTPEAMRRGVMGSGFGLTIARRIMQELGGNLKLGNNREPTEFLMILPKRPARRRNDTIY